MTHGAVRFLIRALEATIILILLGAAVMAWRLSQGPLTLNAVAPYISNAFSDLAPGYHFRIDGAQFRWAGLSGSPELTVRDVRVLDSSGAVIAGLPSMVIRLSTPALKRGIAAPELVRLTNPIMRFVHRADGSLGLGVETPGSAVVGVPAVGVAPAQAPTVSTTDATSGNALAVSLIGALTRAPGGDNPAGYLDRVAIENATIVLVDEVSGQRWLVPDAVLNFTRAAGDVAIDANFPVFEEGKRWNLTAKGGYSSVSGDLKVNLNVDGFRPSRVASLAPQLAPLDAVDLRLSGTAAVTLALTNAGARLRDLQFDVKGQDGQLRLPDPVSQSFPVKALLLKGSAGPDLDRIVIDSLRVELNRGREKAPTIVVSGEGQNLNSAPAVDLKASMAELPLVALKQYWPTSVKPNTRSWIDANLNEGGLYDTRFKLRLTGPNINALDATEAVLTSELRGVDVKYLGSLPHVQETNGIMTIAGTEVVIDITNGHVPDTISGKGLSIPSGKIRLYDLGSGSERANIALKIQGGFGEVMRLIDYQPLGYASLVGLDAKSAAGDANIDLALNFPLIKDLKLDQLKIDVKAKADKVGIPQLAFGLPLTDGQLGLTLDRAGMDVSGSIVLGGIHSTITWRENFGGGEFRSRYELDPIVNNAQRPLVGLSVIPFVPPYLDGPVPAHVIYTINRNDTRTLEARADLTASAMSLPQLGWRKEEGKPASATVTAVFAKDHLESVPTFHVMAGTDLDVSGDLSFTSEGKMRVLSIKPSMVSDTHLAAEVNVDDAGGYNINVSGPAFNSSYFWKDLGRDDARGRAENGNTQFSTPLRIQASFDRMWMNNGGDFRDVLLRFERDYTGIQAIDFTSKINGTVPVTFQLSSDNGKRTFKGRSADGGSVIRAIGLFGDIMGGNLDIDGEFAPDGTIRGVAEVKDFKLIQAPLLARLLSVATLTGIVDELRGQGISFKTLHVPFSYADSTLRVRDGEMYGSSFGLTGHGAYTFPTSYMDFEGTLIPAYSVNSALNSIPLIGSILSGGAKGGGIFAATYTYRGEVATAQPSVNALAALAPGFLRHIFDIFRSSPRPPQPPPPAIALPPETPAVPRN